MKRGLIAVVVLATAFPAIVIAQPKRNQKVKPPCKLSLADCPDEGCGTSFDPNLNRRKNIRSDDQTATARSLTWMKKLDDPESFAQGDSREELISKDHRRCLPAGSQTRTWWGILQLWASHSRGN